MKYWKRKDADVTRIRVTTDLKHCRLNLGSKSYQMDKRFWFCLDFYSLINKNIETWHHGFTCNSRNSSVDFQIHTGNGKWSISILTVVHLFCNARCFTFTPKVREPLNSTLLCNCDDYCLARSTCFVATGPPFLYIWRHEIFLQIISTNHARIWGWD